MWLIFYNQDAASELLNHIITPTDGTSGIQSQGMCPSIYETNHRLICLMDNYNIANDVSVQVDINIKANENDFVEINRFYSKKTDQSHLENLFKENSFLQTTGHITVKTIYRKTEIALVPAYLVGGLKISNPVLPTLNISAVRGSLFRISHYFIFRKWLAAHYGELVLAPRIWYSNQESINGDVDLVGTAGKSLISQLEKENNKKIDGSVAIGIESKHSYYPSVNLKIENLAQEKKCIECEQRFIDVEKHFQMRANASIYVSVTHAIGKSIFGTNLPFWGPYTEFDKDKQSINYIYSLSKLNSFLSYSPLMYSFGFTFSGESITIGIQYSDEKQANQFSINRMKQTYVSTSYNL